MPRYVAKVKRTANFLTVKSAMERRGAKEILTTEFRRAIAFEAAESEVPCIRATPGVESIHVDLQDTPEQA